MILIFTSKRDGHIESVAKHLDSHDARWVRINIEDFATNIDVCISPIAGTGMLHIKDSGMLIDLAEVRAVWYRKPDPVSLSHFSLEPAALDYIEAEMTEVIHGLYGLLDHTHWINNPFHTRLAHRKLLQLKIAREVGFRVPRSLVTNDVREAITFGLSLQGDLAIKSLGAISVITEQEGMPIQYGIFTRRITRDELVAYQDKIRYMPTLFQEFIVKQSELRVTCVGERVFACRITPRPGDLTQDDYRFDTKQLVHEAVEYPELVAPMKSYMRSLGLRFGCFDFAVDTDGAPIFLECNPNGQWLWVEEMTGLPISAAIAAELSSSERYLVRRLRVGH